MFAAMSVLDHHFGDEVYFCHRGGLSLPFHIVEYRIRSRVIYTSPAPCVVANQPADSSYLKECFRGFASELHERGINHIIVLLTKKEMGFYDHGSLLSMYESHGFSTIHYPVADFGIPKSLESFAELQSQLVQITETNPILIHCRAGGGRTGLVIAGLIVALGISPLRALQMVRRKRSVETEEQEQFLIEYAQLLRIA